MTINRDWVFNPDEPNFITAVDPAEHRAQLEAERDALIIKGYEIQRSRDILALIAGDDYTEQLNVATSNLHTIGKSLAAINTLIERLDTPAF